MATLTELELVLTIRFHWIQVNSKVAVRITMMAHTMARTMAHTMAHTMAPTMAHTMLPMVPT